MKTLLRFVWLFLSAITFTVLVAPHTLAAPPVPTIINATPEEDAGSLRVTRVQIAADSSGITVTWRTNRRVPGWVVYGFAPDDLSQNVYARGKPDSRALRHRVRIELSEPRNAVYFQIVAGGVPFTQSGLPFKVEATIPEAGWPPADVAPVTAEMLKQGSRASLAVAEGDLSLPPEELPYQNAAADAPSVEDGAMIATDAAPLTTIEDSEAQAVALPGLTYPGMILADGQFLNGPNVAGFRIDEYLEQSAPHLRPYRDGIVSVSEYFSINPRVLLAVLETTSGLVTNPDRMSDDMRSFSDAGVAQFMEQLGSLGQALYDAYDYHLYHLSALPPAERTLPSFTMPDGSIFQPEAAVNAGSYAVMAALAERESTTAAVRASAEKESVDGFYQTYQRLFPDDNPLSQANDVWIPGLEAPLELPPAGLLQLPYPRGHAWYFNAVHGAAGGSDRSSIDFAPYWLPAVNGDNSYWYVTAAGSGNVAEIPASCQLKINHTYGSQTWQTVYFHLEGIRQAYQTAGATVYKNAVIGKVANTSSEALCYDGRWDGPHVHFVLKYDNGQPAPIQGTDLSGWTVGYNTMTRGSTTKLAATDLLPNNRCDDGIAANGVVLYEHDRYGFYSAGRCLTLTADDGDLTDNSFNDIATGIRLVGTYIGKWEVRLYEHANYQGAMTRAFGDTGDLSPYYIGNDRVSSVRMWPDSDDSRWISSNSAMNGTLDRSYDYDHYYFSGTQGQSVSVRLDAVAADLDPYVFLYDPDGYLVTHDDDSGWSSNSHLRVTLPKTGTYIIRTASFGYASSGAYTVLMQLYSNSGCYVGVHGIILYDNADFDLNGGCMTLTGSDPNLVDNNFNDRTSSIDFAGNYRWYRQVLLTRDVDYWGGGSHFFGDDNYIGDRYIGNDTTSAVLMWYDTDDYRTLGTGAQLAGSMHVNKDVDSYYFYGTAGQNIEFNMTNTLSSPFLDTYLQLYSPAGAFITHDDDSGFLRNARIEIVLPSTGWYQLHARSYNGQSNGAYDISANWN